MTKNLYLLVILLIALIHVNAQENENNRIFHIIDTCVNGTAPFVLLENFNGKYIYFSYDFNPQCVYGNKKDKGYFEILIDENLVLINNSYPLKYILEEKKQENITIREIENANWKDIKHLKKYKKGEERIYFYEVKLDNNKINTVLFRLPTNGNKKGTVYFLFFDDNSYIDYYINNTEYEEDFDDDKENSSDKDNDEDDDIVPLPIPGDNKGNNILSSKIKYLLFILLMII